jgi:hypothetical protein
MMSHQKRRKNLWMKKLVRRNLRRKSSLLLRRTKERLEATEKKKNQRVRKRRLSKLTLKSARRNLEKSQKMVHSKEKIKSTSMLMAKLFLLFSITSKLRRPKLLIMMKSALMENLLLLE